MLTTEEIRKRAREVSDYLIKVYKLEKEERKRDWRTEEEKHKKRIEGMARIFGLWLKRQLKNSPDLEVEEGGLCLLLKKKCSFFF